MSSDILQTPDSSRAPSTFRAVLAALKRIEMHLAGQTATVFNRKQAANFLGVSTATLDRLTAQVPELKPIHPSRGRSVWRRSDLQAYLDKL